MAPQPVVVIAASDLMTFTRLEMLVRSHECLPFRHPLPPEVDRHPETGAVPPGSPLFPRDAADWPDPAALLLLSLTTAETSWSPLIEAARSRGLEVIGVGSHHDRARIDTARRAGCRRIVTNRKLPVQLPPLLRAASESP